MAYRFLAVFDEDVARAPLFLEDLAEHHDRNSLDEVENAFVKDHVHRDLQACYDACKPSSRKLIELERNGFAIEACSYCQYKTKDGVHAVFCGEVSKWPDFDCVESAHNNFMRGADGPDADEAQWLLEYYHSYKDYCTRDVTEGVLAALAKVEGVYAFVLYDEELQRVIVARDRTGAAPMYWGSTKDNRFMLGCALKDLEACSPSATPFPAGCLYASEGPNVAVHAGQGGWIMPGRPHHGNLFSFVESQLPGRKWRELKAIPRMTPEGTLCGAVYKVASEQNLKGRAW